MGCRISHIEYYLPQIVLDNVQLSQEFPEWEAEKINEKIGVKQRRIAGENETAMDLGLKATGKVLEKFDKSLIDFVLFCTQSPDYFLPTSACIIQDRLGLRQNIGALDFNLGCSGFIYGLALSKGLIQIGVANHVLLITSETYSKHLHIKDKANRSIFGDGATATIISKSESDSIMCFELGTDGAGMSNLIVANGAFRNKFNDLNTEIFENGVFVRSNNNLFMNGPEIFNFTLGKIPELIKTVLEKNDCTIDSIDYFVFHQANKFMLDYLRKKLKIPESRFYQNMEFTGNTVSATIPIAVTDCLTNSIIKPGDKVLIAGFGVGYSWGATILKI
jgi:3-oxoacyl-[acyl-carrier-protein] synthase III